LLLALTLLACATPAERVRQRAAELQLTPIPLAGAGFDHVAFMAGGTSGGRTLHVYIEHDGTPWLGGTRVSPDPAPRTPVALELMARDDGPRLFLGRPCYYEPDADPRCTPLLWTHQRYSPDVVRSMVAALRRFLVAQPYDRIVLIGYSGGGTLAWLMASDVPATAAVVTLAANLDTDLWTGLHGYSPLSGSLNPALQPPLPATIAQVHYAGERDDNVPPRIAASFARNHPHARIIVLADYDHVCCWIEGWPALLDLPGVAR
jgi:dienelactone hydrolase